MTDLEQRERFIELRAKGLSFDKISKEIDISKPTLLKMQAELNKRIQEEKILEYELLAEKANISKKARIERLQKELSKMDKALESKDYSELPTDKLYEMRSKVLMDMKKEFDSVGVTVGGAFESDFERLNGVRVGIE